MNGPATHKRLKQPRLAPPPPSLFSFNPHRLRPTKIRAKGRRVHPRRAAISPSRDEASHQHRSRQAPATALAHAAPTFGLRSVRNLALLLPKANLLDATRWVYRKCRFDVPLEESRPPPPFGVLQRTNTTRFLVPASTAWRLRSQRAVPTSSATR